MGKKISELQNKSTLSGNERIPFEQDNVNGSITTSSLKNYISHEIGEGGGGTNGGGSMNTEFKKYITTYSVSQLHPDFGNEGDNRYDFERAIRQIPDEFKHVGLIITFINMHYMLEEWQYIYYGFDNKKNWTQLKLSKLQINNINSLGNKLHLNSNDYLNFFVSNVNTGALDQSLGNINSYLVKVDGGASYKIDVPNPVHDNVGKSIQLYTDYPSISTNVSNAGGILRENILTVPTSVRYIVINVNAEINEETTIEQTNYIDNSVIKSNAISLDKLDKDIKDVISSSKEVIVKVNNFNYIKNWPEVNKIVKRIYVENKEKAIQDGLCVVQVFKDLNGVIGKSAINFGIIGDLWSIQLLTLSNENKLTTNTKYGKIEVLIDWDRANSQDVFAFTNLTGESNLEDIAFDIDEFNNFENSYGYINDKYITEQKLSDELVNKIESKGLSQLEGYELFTLCDSLGQEGTWQQKVAELTGCYFDQNKNIKPGASLSVGGTSSYGEGFDNMLWRAKNLIDSKYIKDKGKNAIIILENVNDFSNSIQWNYEDKVLIPTDPIEGYSYEQFNEDTLNRIPQEKRKLNAVMRLTKTSKGKRLTITKLPVKEGDITLKVGWAGSGVKEYNIHIKPQNQDQDTYIHILNKILEYSYTGITDTLSEKENSVDFSITGGSYDDYTVRLEFVDYSSTGMQVSIEDIDNAKTSVAKYFIGNNVNDEWTNISKWIDGSTMSFSTGWKSTIEQLIKNYPESHIFIAMFPAHSVTANEYLQNNGYYDTAGYSKNDRMLVMNNFQDILKSIANFYSIPFINVFKECGINITNILTYYNSIANVHPKKEGYIKFGETVAAQLKRNF